MKPWQTLSWRTLGVVLLLVGLDRGLYHLGNHGKWIVQERHPTLGWQMLPNQRGWSRDYTARENTNSLGYRGARWPAAPPAVRASYRPGAPLRSPVEGDARADDALRIAVVGNSMTYGSGVEEAETWPAVLEALLAEELAKAGDLRQVQVMNFAVQGYVFDQMARTFHMRIAPFLPDVLVVPTTTYDAAPMPRPEPVFDYPLRRLVERTAIHDFGLRRVQGKWMPRPAAPNPDGAAARNRREAALAERWDGAAEEDRETAWLLFAADLGASPSAAPDVKRAVWLEHASRAEPRTLERLWERAKGPERAALLELLPNDQHEQVRQILQRDLAAHPFQPTMRWLFERMGSQLEAIQSDLADRGGRLVFVALPTQSRLSRPEQPSTSVYFGPWAKSPDPRRGGPRALDFDPADGMRERMPRLAKYLRDESVFERTARGEKHIPADAPFAGESLFFLHDVGHYNPRGHRALAEELARFLIQSGALDPLP